MNPFILHGRFTGKRKVVALEMMAWLCFNSMELIHLWEAAVG